MSEVNFSQIIQNLNNVTVTEVRMCYGFIFLLYFCVLPAFHLLRKGWMDNNGLQCARESRCRNLKESGISSFRDSFTLQAILLKGIRLSLVKHKWSITSFWFCSVVK